MGKGNGSTRSSSAGAPKALSNTRSGDQYETNAERLNRQEDAAERFYRGGDLLIDPGDAVYSNLYGNVRNNPTAISESIENLTDYDAILSDNYVELLPRHYDSADLIRDYGEDSFRIPYEDKTLMDIVDELRRTSMSKLFSKYK